MHLELFNIIMMIIIIVVFIITFIIIIQSRNSSISYYFGIGCRVLNLINKTRGISFVAIVAKLRLTCAHLLFKLLVIEGFFKFLLIL